MEFTSTPPVVAERSPWEIELSPQSQALIAHLAGAIGATPSAIVNDLIFSAAVNAQSRHLNALFGVALFKKTKLEPSEGTSGVGMDKAPEEVSEETAEQRLERLQALARGEASSSEGAE